MGFLDTHDAFVDARRNWEKYNLGVDFDTAWHNYYDKHYDPENLQSWADPVWSEEAWNNMVRENGGDPDLYKDDYSDIDTFGESVRESFDIMTATDIVSAMYDKYPEVEFVYEDGPKDGEVLLVFDLGDSPLDMEELTSWLEDCGADVSFAGPYMKLLVPEDEMDESLRTKLFKRIGCYSDGSPMEESLSEGFDPDKDYKITFQTTEYGDFQSHIVSGKDVEEVLKKMKEHKYIVWPVEELDTNESLTEDEDFEKVNLINKILDYAGKSEGNFNEIEELILWNEDDNIIIPDLKAMKNHLENCDINELKDIAEDNLDESLTEGAMTNGSYSLYNGWVKVPDKDSIPDEYPDLEPEYSE